MTSVLPQYPNTRSTHKIQTYKRFKRTLIYNNTDTKSAHFRGSPLCQATKRHLNKVKRLKTMKNDLSHLLSFLTVYLLFKCRFVA